MSDTRWAKVENCGTCPYYFVYEIQRREYGLRCGKTGTAPLDSNTIHPNCPLLHLRDIPEVIALGKAAFAALTYFMVAEARERALSDDETKIKADLFDALKPIVNNAAFDKTK